MSQTPSQRRKSASGTKGKEPAWDQVKSSPWATSFRDELAIEGAFDRHTLKLCARSRAIREKIRAKEKLAADDLEDIIFFLHMYNLHTKATELLVSRAQTVAMTISVGGAGQDTKLVALLNDYTNYLHFTTEADEL